MIFFMISFIFLIYTFNMVKMLLFLILLSLIMSLMLFFSQFSFLFYMWVLVYIGGMMISFTYVVFFSQSNSFFMFEKSKVKYFTMFYQFFLISMLSKIFFFKNMSIKNLIFGNSYNYMFNNYLSYVIISLNKSWMFILIMFFFVFFMLFLFLKILMKKEEKKFFF